MSWVPLPWCTSQSTIATRSAPWTRWATRAAIAALLKKQKPIAWARSAWWPGGRMAAKAFVTLPVITSSTAWTAAPALRSAASSVPGDKIVSESMETSPSRGDAAKSAST